VAHHLSRSTHFHQHPKVVSSIISSKLVGYFFVGNLELMLLLRCAYLIDCPSLAMLAILVHRPLRLDRVGLNLAPTNN
jgi:hypothetical protein